MITKLVDWCVNSCNLKWATQHISLQNVVQFGEPLGMQILLCASAA